MSSVHTTTTRPTTFSLPSFAQTFSNPPMPASQALPPIQTLSSSEDLSTTHPIPVSKKRPRRPDSADESPNASDHGSQPPPPVRIKEEQDELVESPRPMHAQAPSPHLPDTSASGSGSGGSGSSGAPLPSLAQPPHSKKRRTTLSGVRLNTNIHLDPADSNNSTPISPSVIAGLPVHRDDRSTAESIRSAANVRRSQEALIEQRRGSIPGHSPPYVPSLHITKSPFPEMTSNGQPPSARESPSLTSANRRPTISTPSLPRIPSSPPPISGGGHTHNLPSILPAPPNSFGSRRAFQPGGGKRKPADLQIQPRDPRSTRELRPTIQSAPAFPRAGQEQYAPGTFPVTLPTIPNTLGAPTIRRTAAPVPPTPTRFSVRPSGPSGSNTGPQVSISGRSPPVPIASTLVPPTPTTLRQPGYATEKTAFLAPFETFYDALADARELKTWLHQQVQRANDLTQTLQQQQDRVEDIVAVAVERATAGQRDEVQRLHMRVAELEGALRARDYPAPPLRGPGSAANGASPPMSKLGESYTYPPVERPQQSHQPPAPSPSTGSARPALTRRISSSPHQGYDARTASPPYDPRRISAVSATRFEPPPPPPPSSGRGPPGSPVASGRHLAPLPSHLSSSASSRSGGAGAAPPPRERFVHELQPTLARHHSGGEQPPSEAPSSSSSRLQPPRTSSDDQPARGRPRSRSSAG